MKDILFILCRLCVGCSLPPWNSRLQSSLCLCKCRVDVCAVIRGVPVCRHFTFILINIIFMSCYCVITTLKQEKSIKLLMWHKRDFFPVMNPRAAELFSLFYLLFLVFTEHLLSGSTSAAVFSSDRLNASCSASNRQS